MKKPSLNAITTALATLGALSMGYLLTLHYGNAGSSLCHFSDKISCDIVNKSIYSEIMGIPVSGLGLLYFLAVIALAHVKTTLPQRQIIAAFTLFSLVFGLYLSAIEFTVIKSVCLFCEFSKVLMLGMLASVLLQMKQSGERLEPLWHLDAAVAGVILSATSFFLQS
jgi:uncharacterized membrane protein